MYETKFTGEYPEDKFRIGPEFLGIQVAFAKKAAELKGIDLGTSLFQNTNIHRRLGLGKIYDPNNEKWKEFVSGLNGEDDAQHAFNYYLKRGSEVKKEHDFGCFSYDYDPETGEVRIHFANQDEDSISPLTPEKRPQRIAELTKMFTDIKSKFPEAKTVRGESWLYNLSKYKNLFPQEYTSNLTPKKEKFTSIGLWGQFLDKDKNIKPQAAAEFLKKVDGAKKEEDLAECFLFQALAAGCPIENFYKYYQVS